MRRESGVLMPISSLWSRYGIGCFSKEAYAFIDSLKESGQAYWQVLPLVPTGYGDSPYQSFSSFAGNPYFISLEELIDEGLLKKEECELSDFGNDPGYINYEKIYKNRIPLLYKAYSRSNVKENANFLRYREDNSWWLRDYAIFMAVKSTFEGMPWTEWADDIKYRNSNALDYYQRELYYEIEFYEYIQFLFYTGFTKLKKYANDKGISIIGDLPIYVALDSVDTWVNADLFLLNENKKPISVAGCPPDALSQSGQLWNNPLYNWQRHKETNFSWWISRIRYCYKLYDVIRLDHFRGFEKYYKVPFGAIDAKSGDWEDGPGVALFNQLKKDIGDCRVIAEDLGFITPEVKALLKNTGYPGMKVLQFAFDVNDKDGSGDHLPHNYIENCVAYTGTHDNETILGWYKGISPEKRAVVKEYLCDYNTKNIDMHIALISLLMRSSAYLTIIPIQDFLGFYNDARINIPSTLGGLNWRWRMKNGLTTNDIELMKSLTKRYGRFN